jgi:signal transduction histidine kinase
LTALFAVCGLAAAGQTPSKPLDIRVGAYENYPKVYTDKDGNIIGFFPEILHHIASAEEWNIEYIPGSWSQSLARLEKNEIDLMVDVAFSERRSKKYDFTSETVLINWGILYTRQNFQIESLFDLRGKTIAVMKDSIHTVGEEGIKNVLNKFNIACAFIEVDGYKEVFELLNAGKADAGVVNRIFGSLFEKDFEVVKTAFIFNPRQLKFALPKNSPHNQYLIEKIDKHVRELKKDRQSIYHRALDIYLSGLPRDWLHSTTTANQERKILLTEAERTWLKKHRVIRLGADPEFTPFEYITDDGTYSGIASDYIKILNERLDIEMQVVPGLNWTEAVQAARNKEIDVLPCVGKTQERLSFLRYSRPYIKFHRVIITRTDYPFIAGLEDIRNLRIAVQADTSHEGFLQDNTDMEYVRYSTLQECLTAVSSGKADAFVGNIASSTYWIRRLNLTNLKAAAPVSPEVLSLYFAVRRDWPELVGIINKGLASISPEEENEIIKKWVSVEYKPGIAPKIVWRYISRIAGVALFILIVILAWNYRLKKEITKRKKMATMLQEYADKLEKANIRLQELDRLKSLFIASMSHELRTPLNSIIGFTGVILQGMSGDLNSRQQDQLNRVNQSAKHLLALITDVIDISKIEAGRMEVYPEPFLLTEIVKEVFAGIQPQLNAKKLSYAMDVPDDLKMNTDRKRLLQCIINYVSNAVKYTEKGGIKISARQIDDEVEILVNDSGIGIDERDIPKLFEAFERLETHLKIKAGGTGLGLYLTRKLVTDLLQGTTLVESQPGKGSTFGIRIPKDLG